MSQQQAMCMKTMKMQLQDMTEEVFPVKERKKTAIPTHEMLKILNADLKHIT